MLNHLFAVCFFADRDGIIFSIPALTVFPEKGELDHGTLRTFQRGQIGEPDIQRANRSGFHFVGAGPVISGPDDGCFCRNDEAQDFAVRHPEDRMMRAPHFVRIFYRLDDIALEDRFDSIKTNAIVSAAHE